MSVIVGPSSLPWADPIDLTGQVAVVSGGSGGIGLAIAQQLEDRGCQVVITSRNAERVNQALDSLKNGFGFPNCDIRNPNQVSELFDFVIEKFQVLDILVVCAGIGRSERTPAGLPRAVAQLEEYDWDDVIDTNLRGAFLMCRAAAGIMVKQRRGQILNISSARGAIKGQPCGAGYCASKMAVRAMFQSLAAELSAFGVRAMTLLPDAVDTSLIAGTTLAPQGALDRSEVGKYVADMLSMPMDASLCEPLLAPLGSRSKKNRKQNGPN